MERKSSLYIQRIVREAIFEEVTFELRSVRQEPGRSLITAGGTRVTKAQRMQTSLSELKTRRKISMEGT